MSNDLHVREQLAAYALDCLDDEEMAQVAQHLTACPGCRAELEAYEAVVDRMALAAPEVAPPPGLKAQILGSLQTPRPVPVAAPRISFWQRLVERFRGAAPAWGIAGLVLVALLAFTNLWWWRQSDPDAPFVTPGGMQVVAMAGTEAAPSAAGTLVISEDGEYGTLVVDGLPALDGDHQYQLWLIRDGQRTSGGVFSVNPEGYGALWIASPEPLSSYPAFGITVEPAGGSPGPTGDKVLGGGL
jgi:anti-sigma-K factor RskA